MTAGEFCNRDVVVATPDTPVVKGAGLMRSHHVGCLVVLGDGEEAHRPVVGLVTDRDLVVEVLAQDVNPVQVTIGDVMTPDPVTVNEDDSLWGAIKVMRLHGIRRLPVLDAQGNLTGLLTVDDLLDLLSTELSQLSNLVNYEQTQETRRRP